MKYLPGIAGAACLIAGATLLAGVAVGLLVAGVLLLVIDGRVRT